MTDQKIQIVVKFADVRGFTHLAEEMVPKDVARLLNRFYRLTAELRKTGNKAKSFPHLHTSRRLASSFCN